MAMTSWRYNFIDINKSIVQKETEPADIIGYMACRAPKGETEALYFAPGSEEEIKAMIGLPSAHYPDIYEAIEFNKNYGLYISAPAGNKTSMPSYYGGAYYTKYGWLPFYKETSKDKPSMLTSVTPGSEKDVLNGTKSSKVSIPAFTIPETSGSKPEDSIKISGITYEVMNKSKYLDFDYWGYDSRAASTYRYGWTALPKAEEDTVDLYCYVNGNLDTSHCCGKITVQIDGETQIRTYTIDIGGKDNGSVTAPASDAPFINFSNLIPSNSAFGDYKEELLAGATEDGGVTTSTWFDEGQPGKKVMKALEDGSTIVVGDVELSIPAVKNYFHFIMDVSKDAYCYVNQKSPTSVVTRVTVDNINFDKYEYDVALQIFKSEPKDGIDNVTNPDNIILIGSVGNFAPYQYTEVYDEDTDSSSFKFVNISADFIDKKVLIAEAVDTDNGKLVGKIYYFEDDGGGTSSKAVEMSEDAEVENYKLKVDTMYNTFDLSCSETDFEGNEVNGGSWTGSLDEYGVDQWDAGNYFEDVFPTDSVSYIEIHPLKVFDSDTANGFYLGNRHTSYDFTISGERYIEKAINKNIAENNVVGAVWHNSYTSVINEALVEAKKPKYEECQIFIEPTGRSEFQAKLSAIRDAHNTSTVIAPFLISETQFNKPSTIQVGTRKRGVAYYVGEFLVLDKNVRKKYYANLIGSVGAMLAKIMDERYGGVAPAWINDSGYGGQLDRVVLKPRWDMPDSMTKILDTKGLNPIIMNADDGIMITSQKTSELNAGDWSYLGHSMAFDLFKREVREDVMKPQLMKTIDDFWIDVRQEQMDRILAKRTNGSRRIWTEAICDIAGVNTPQTKAQRNFIISVGVKVTPFSEFVTLKLTNVGQTMNVADEM